MVFCLADLTNLLVTHCESIWEIDLMKCVMTAPKLHLDVTPQNTIMVEVRIFSSDAILRTAAFYARRGFSSIQHAQTYKGNVHMNALI